MSVQINYNGSIIIGPEVEEKTEKHYNFIKTCFDSYISLKDFLNRDDLYVVVVKNGNSVIIGLTLVRTTQLYKTHFRKLKTGRRIIVKRKDNKVLRIMYTLVSKKYRGKGINQVLLNYIYEKCKEDGKVNTIIANIRESNVKSINSFKKNGFKISKEKTKPYKNGEKKIRVFKNIKN